MDVTVETLEDDLKEIEEGRIALDERERVIRKYYYPKKLNFLIEKLSGVKGVGKNFMAYLPELSAKGEVWILSPHVGEVIGFCSTNKIFLETFDVCKLAYTGVRFKY